MNKIFSILGLVLLAITTAFGFFVKVPTADIVAIAGGFFSATLIAINVIKNREKDIDWKYYCIVFSAVLSGVLCCIGGVKEEVITSVSGAVIALITIIVGVVTVSKKVE